jgi:hypothetical protein
LSWRIASKRSHTHFPRCTSEPSAEQAAYRHSS